MDNTPPPPISSLQHHHHDARLVQPTPQPQVVAQPQAGPQATLPRQSPKRVRLNPSQKEAVLALLASGARIDYVVETFGIAKRTVFKIQRAQRLKEAQEIQDRADATAAAVAAGKQPPVHAPFNVALPSNDVMQDGNPGNTAAAAAAGNGNGVNNNGNPAAMATAGVSESNAGIPGPSGTVAGMAHPQLLNAIPPSAQKQNHAGPKKSSPPAKRVRLNVSEKLDICNFVQQGGTPAEVIEKYGISRRTFFKILHDEQDIRQTVDRDHVSAETKSIRPPHFPLLDQSLSAFVLSARAARVPLNWHMVREQALRLRTELLESGKERPERIPHLERFTASEHWCQLFMRKNASKKLPAALEDPVQPTRRYALKETKHMQGQLGAFEADNVYTLVTPRLYYRHIPNRFFAQGHDNIHVKHEKYEPTITPVVQPSVESIGHIPAGNTNPQPSGTHQEPYVNLLVASNLTGTKRLPIAMIVPPSQEKMFDTRRPCLPCMVRPNQKCDSIAFAQWLRDIFIPHTVVNNRGKVALMLDETMAVAASASFGHHDQHVLFVMVPRLSICMTETAKNGIFPLLVARYRFKLFETYSALVPLREQLRVHATIIPEPHRGLAEGNNATVYDAADILREAWAELPADRIARLWWRMNVLPENIVGQLEAIYGPTSDVGTITEVSGFVLNIVRPSPVGKEGLGALTNGKARWISVVEVIRWFTYEYEMMPKNNQQQAQLQIGHGLSQQQPQGGHPQQQQPQGGHPQQHGQNGRLETQHHQQNGLDWNAVVQQAEPMGVGVAPGQMPGPGQSVPLGTLADNTAMNVGGTTGTMVAGETDVDMGKLTQEQFGRVMKYYADLERSIIDMHDVEALRYLRNAKKASLSYFVSNGNGSGSGNTANAPGNNAAKNVANHQ